jgi:ubiquitin C-terminal hydrolase
MDLLPYNPNYASKAQGIPNRGNTCYLNSLLQCLLSCPSIYEVLSKSLNKEHVKGSKLAMNLYRLFKDSAEGKSLDAASKVIWYDLINTSMQRKDRERMTLGSQQDSHEGIMLLLESIEKIPEVKRLFEYRQTIKIFCDACQQTVVDKKEQNLVFDVQPDLKTEQVDKFKDIDKQFNQAQDFNTFLKEQNGFVSDFICPKCKHKGDKFKTTKISMLPEIIAVVIKKYRDKCITTFPIQLEFNTIDGKKKLIYRLVAQSEHSGGMYGGHYWATCLRIENNQCLWKTLNDSMVNNGNPGPTANTYLVFYHYFMTKDV